MRFSNDVIIWLVELFISYLFQFVFSSAILWFLVFELCFHVLDGLHYLIYLFVFGLSEYVDIPIELYEHSYNHSFELAGKITHALLTKVHYYGTGNF